LNAETVRLIADTVIKALGNQSLLEAQEQIDAEICKRAMFQSGGVVTRAAELLNINRVTLTLRRKKHGMKMYEHGWDSRLPRRRKGKKRPATPGR
jgi:DNA-binding NtrC family response regulator